MTNTIRDFGNTLMSFTEFAAKKARGQQGKSSESKVAEYLNALNNSIARFDWQRGYDARSAGGKFQRVAGDYTFFSPHIHGVIEVKEVDHEFRLPYKNFDNSAVAKCVKRKLAGGVAIVLVYFTPVAVWRMMPIDTFQHRDLSKGSWDLGEWPIYTKVDHMLDPTIKAGVMAVRTDHIDVRELVEDALTQQQ